MDNFYIRQVSALQRMACQRTAAVLQKLSETQVTH